MEIIIATIIVVAALVFGALSIENGLLEIALAIRAMDKK